MRAEALASWDVFHSDRLEVERGLSTSEVLAGMAQGAILEDDLARPAGSSLPWTRIGDLPDLMNPPASEREPQQEEPQAEPPSEPAAPLDRDSLLSLLEGDQAEAPPQPGPDSSESVEALIVDDDEDEPPPTQPIPASALPAQADVPLGEYDLNLDREEDQVELTVDDDRPFVNGFPEEGAEFDPQDEDEAAAEFTLSRRSAQKIEELDLAAMVDVAFQMVLFFMVTAATVLYKTLELPKTNPDAPPSAVAQGEQRKTIDDLQNDFILVEVNPQGEIRVDHEPADPSRLVERLRSAREETGRTAMLLSADFATPHKHAVLAYDAANEIGLRIAIAKPTGEDVLPPPPGNRQGG